MGAVPPPFAHVWRRSDYLGALGESGGLAARLLALADDHKF
jgi:hypothetical protein